MSGQRVLVTGASGYIATHLVQQLLQQGYTVRGTVRSLKNEEKVKPIRELCPDSQYPLELVEADLLDDNCWKDAVRDCDFVCHTASPFPNTEPKHEDEIIKPAVEGTLRVLRACAEVGGIKRVVLTSSVVAVIGGLIGERGHVYSEKDWPDLNKVNFPAYPKSKTLAEKAAWDFVKDLPENQRFELAAINPGLVLGPVLCNAFTTSMELPQKLLERQIPCVFELDVFFADVRDVAKAHIQAMKVPEAVGNRHILVGCNAWMGDVAKILDKEFGPQGYNIPTKVAPNFLLKIAGVFDKTIKMVAPGAGIMTKLDNSRMKNVLGIDPIPCDETVIDMAYSMIEAGKVKKTSKYKGRV